MRVFITSVGSQGDVRPYVALGAGLKAAGHAVTICASRRFESLVGGHGLVFAPLTDALLELMDSVEGRQAMEGGSGLLGGLKAYARLIRQVGPIQRQMVAESWDAVQQANPKLIVYHPKAFWGSHFADHLGIPAIFAPLVPMFVPTAERPNLGFPNLGLGGWYNRLTYRLVLGITDKGTSPYVKAWRKANHVARGTRVLQMRSGAPIPVLHACSGSVVPVPADWPPTATATGYWFLNGRGDWHPPPVLQQFLETGPAPVYVGFGSMAGRRPGRLARIVIEALAAAGVRGIIATGWGGMESEARPDSVMWLREAPHDWLFPRVAAVVHHGGAGTTAAGLGAGRPTVVCPFMGDQSYWGRRVHELGAGVAPIPQRKLTVDRLAAALRDVTTNADIRRRAENLGEQIRGEDGVGTAVRIIGQIAAGIWPVAAA